LQKIQKCSNKSFYYFPKEWKTENGRLNENLVPHPFVFEAEGLKAMKEAFAAIQLNISWLFLISTGKQKQKQQQQQQQHLLQLFPSTVSSSSDAGSMRCVYQLGQGIR